MYAIAYVLFLPYCQKHGITAYCYWHSPHNQPTHIVPCTFRSENFVTPTEALRSVPLLYPYPKTIPKPWPSHATYSFKYVYTASKRKSASNFAEMSGATGSGKSTLANLPTQSLNGIVINHDLLKSFLLESGGETHIQPPMHTCRGRNKTRADRYYRQHLQLRRDTHSWSRARGAVRL
jgi:hypothetical protein